MSTQEKMLEELKKIREALEPKPPPTPEKPKGLWNEFMDFISKYKVMGMAVAFIMGIYLGALVKAFVDDLIMPIITLVMPGMRDWKQIKVEPGPFLVGDFIGGVDNISHSCLRNLPHGKGY